MYRGAGSWLRLEPRCRLLGLHAVGTSRITPSRVREPSERRASSGLTAPVSRRRRRGGRRWIPALAATGQQLANCSRAKLLVSGDSARLSVKWQPTLAPAVPATARGPLVRSDAAGGQRDVARDTTPASRRDSLAWRTSLFAAQVFEHAHTSGRRTRRRRQGAAHHHGRRVGMIAVQESVGRQPSRMWQCQRATSMMSITDNQRAAVRALTGRMRATNKSDRRRAIPPLSRLPIPDDQEVAPAPGLLRQVPATQGHSPSSAPPHTSRASAWPAQLIARVPSRTPGPAMLTHITALAARALCSLRPCSRCFSLAQPRPCPARTCRHEPSQRAPQRETYPRHPD